MLEYRQIDWKLIGSALVLSIIGIILIYSAQYDVQTGDSMNYYSRQMIWLAIALVTLIVLIHIPLRMIDFFSYLVYIGAFVLLLLVLIIGQSKGGAARWFALGPIHLTPSDIAKLALMAALSRFLAYSKLPPQSIKRLFVSGLLTVIPVMLILKQPDLGTSIVFIALLFSLWFWSGLSPFYLLLIVSPIFSLLASFHLITLIIYLVILITAILIARRGILVSFFAVMINFIVCFAAPIIWNDLISGYQRLRILTFLDPGRDPRQAGYQIIQSKIAIGSGGITGKGFLGGTQSQLKFLPERHTDFIFSVLGEEFGFLGTLLVVLIFTYIVYRGVAIAARCRSKFASNLAWGAVTILFFQFFVNVGMTFGLMPVTGLPLPFLSYGGTSLIMSWTLIAFLILADYYWTEY